MKIVHFADVHLGTANFGWLDPSTGLHTRILDFLDALDALCGYIEHIGPDLVLFAGDAFRTRTPNPTLSKHFADRVQRIADVCPLVMLIGNHDRQKSGDAKHHSIDIMENLGAKYTISVISDIRHMRMTVGVGCELLHIISIPWLYDTDTSQIVKSLCGVYDEMLDDYVEDEPIILLAHASVEGAMLNDSYTTTLGDECTLPIDIFEDFTYAALGHLHKHQAIAKNAVYAGSLERVDWGERDDDKGFVLISIVDGEALWQFASLNPRPMIDISIKAKDVKYICNRDVSDDAIVRVTVDAPRSASESTIHRAVSSQLADAYLVDSIKVIKPSAARDLVKQRRTVVGMQPANMLDEWIEDNIPDDAFADAIYDAGVRLIEEVNEREGR